MKIYIKIDGISGSAIESNLEVKSTEELSTLFKNLLITVETLYTEEKGSLT